MTTAATATSYVMYVILRRDLHTKLGWPLGAVCTQAAHAASAAMWIFRNDPNTEVYTSDLDAMHKVTLGVDSEEEIKKVADKLETRKIDHKVWIEDGFPVAIALKPYQKEEVKNALKGLKLY
uniref:peptidyl-tRNA hydrolase n=1 Tax=Caenorhabditis japonica TaxID=281687 RepID=A0A8R1HRT7_CAEJA